MTSKIEKPKIITDGGMLNAFYSEQWSVFVVEYTKNGHTYSLYATDGGLTYYKDGVETWHK